jgi:hypothetical protein
MNTRTSTLSAGLSLVAALALAGCQSAPAQLEVVPAGDTITLMPGADHIMLMGLNQPLLAGETLSITIELDDGGELMVEADVRDYQGANEEYHSGDMNMDMDGSDDGEMHQNGME